MSMRAKTPIKYFSLNECLKQNNDKFPLKVKNKNIDVKKFTFTSKGKFCWWFKFSNEFKKWSSCDESEFGNIAPMSKSLGSKKVWRIIK
jgi:hypothetical protein